MTTGSCLCGEVTIQIEGQLEPIQVCHCSQCRKAQGGPFATNIPVQRSAVNVVSGAHLMASYESSPGKQRVFCSRCGSPLFSQRDADPGTIRIRAGLLDEPLDTRPAVHFYVASKAGWWDIDDELPKHAAAYTPRQPPRGD
ncbi:GFA family protein [Pseudomonas sp. gcc21]|uniref:GFA family protein n=1 Tax=Pseudomonas sp. gcc21 TaxID=2726989 RepID=UPI00145134B8|nr:GFA family protein [Pseudomonas sp. gcc21]QJD59352.1 GFA family protein [Pseudomonas sp. gcc21]